MGKFINTILGSLLDFAYPQVCPACNKSLLESDNQICVECLWSLPKTESHFNPSNFLLEKFWGKIHSSGNYAFLKFSKRGIVQNILHSLKYKNKPQLAEFLGRIYAQDLKGMEFIPKTHFLIPVPLYKSRLADRGYNQAAKFAEGLSAVWNIPVREDLLIKTKKTNTQTKTGGRSSRYKNLLGTFSLGSNNEDLSGSTVVLVDDVLTTGATLEVAAEMLWNGGIKELYIVTIAVVY